MLHLPGLVLSDQIGQVLQAVNKIGLAVRGLYGEGTESLGNLYQISNQSTLGESEETIIRRLERVIAQVATHEHNAREKLLEDDPEWSPTRSAAPTACCATPTSSIPRRRSTTSPCSASAAFSGFSRRKPWCFATPC
jgi:hypothetical protein